MIVAEVLQSAEAMKAAVGHLEQFMEKSESSSRGKVVLATVKGDVHDIGKNLVEIILGNNGYHVVNLGIKVPPEDLIAAFREHEPDAIGLSGLLVKSAQQMVVTAKDLAAADIDCPILVGGAALSNRFTRLRIAPEYPGIVAYAQDAMTGLELAKRLGGAETRRRMVEDLEAETEKLSGAEQRRASRPVGAAANGFKPADVRRDVEIPTPPDLKTHVVDDLDLAEVFAYVNPVMLYTRHLGFKGDIAEAAARGDERALELRAAVEQVENEMLARPDIRARAVYRFFPARAQGTRLEICTPSFDRVVGAFDFGRQQRDGGLCLTDYVATAESGKRDFVAMFATTVGPGVRALADQWKDAGDYLKSHILQALALEGAEAAAELVHRKLRAMWGFADPPTLTNKDLFQARYRGVRVSFGYPACPRLEDQAELWRLLDPTSTIGVELTEGFMMDPESSVSALVFHHPDAKYFSLTESDIALLEDRLAGAV
jgi:5-methyltetrahydrofolate--homocysteine methyltransferase